MCGNFAFVLPRLQQKNWKCFLWLSDTYLTCMCSEFFTALAEVTTVCTTLNKMKLFIYNRGDRNFCVLLDFIIDCSYCSEKIPIFYSYITTWTILAFAHTVMTAITGPMNAHTVPSSIESQQLQSINNKTLFLKTVKNRLIF